MDKLEKHIREKLQKREIEPSMDTWNKIEAQLGGVESKPKNGKVYWYAIAASFIGVLLVSIVFFNNGLENESVIQVVDVVKEDSSNIKPEKKLQNKTSSVEETVAQETLSIPLKESKKEALKFEAPIKNDFVLNDYKEKEVLVEEKIRSGEQELFDNKLNQLLKTVVSMEQRNIAVTDAEIDSLLMTAQRELLTDKVFQENGKVDAMALLNEAEDELDRTFRGQLFEKLKDGFFKVRTAVADRNN